MLIMIEKYGFTVETTHISSYHVQYSDANSQWGLQLRFKDSERPPEYLYLSDDKAEVEDAYRQLNNKISERKKPYGTRG